MPSTFLWAGRPAGRWLLLFLLLSTVAAVAQTPKTTWIDAAPASAAARVSVSGLTQFRAVRFQTLAMRTALQAASAPRKGAKINQGIVLSLPLPDGSSQRFQVTETAVLHPRLAALYPRIKTYSAQSLDDPTTTAHLDLTPTGFHAQILTGATTVYIDPAAPGDTVNHRVFYRSAMRQGGAACLTTDVKRKLPPTTNQLRANGAQLRTYRLAVACTGEYAITKGGTKAAALAGIVTTINRVNGIYEQELAIQLQMVPTNEALIFLDPATDPYTNTNASDLLTENQRTTDALIGSANYDLGHVFGTRVGGLAYVGTVCNASFKAGGTTGQADPSGDAFAVDFVAHELGHQFGADHTFNGTTGFCTSSRAASWAYEPGSGGSIMSYAGLCAPQNIQPSSFPYFHSRSRDQILDYVTAFGTCAQITGSGNLPPVVDAGGNFSIPARTPFTLTGTGSDPNGDAVSYIWEQNDMGPAGNPTTPAGDAPLFRFLPPSASTSRTFPDLASLLSATTLPPGELLPTYARRLHFRLVARDQQRPAGGTDYDTTSVAVIGTAGPFTVAPVGASWQADTDQQVNWAVAATDQAPINATQVDILLSTDGGLTFPITLAAATPNDGCQIISVPASLNTTTARIKVQATENIFFAISPQNFSIQAITAPTFYLTPSCLPGGILALCPGTSTTLGLNIGQTGGFAGDVALSAADVPAGVTVNFAPSSVAVGSTTAVSIAVGTAATPGTYSLLIKGTSGSLVQEQRVSLVIEQVITQVPQPTSPDATLQTSQRPRFGWNNLPGAMAYEVQIATDVTFLNIVASQINLSDPTFTPTQELAAGARYFWRVRGRSVCGVGPYSIPILFQTSPSVCQSIVATRVPVSISAGPNAEAAAVINISSTERVSNIRVRNVVITAPNADGLILTLTSPSGRQATLLARACAGTANLNTSFDDQAAALICPPESGVAVRPVSPLANLINDLAAGDWTLAIRNQSTGQATLTGWALELCTIPTVLSNTVVSAVPADLEVFPNPSEGIFEVNLNNNQRGPVTMLITDAIGRTIRSETLPKMADHLSYRLDLSTVSRGIYHLRLTSAQGTSIRRLVRK
ncbi:proprotein convertase P-domain-containing protein [Hymenobacter sp. BT188]|uniref:reprolysin-like metallopeptidase n=1 Tax=Hymenobacter sp. BT188 TaxID=2763504 RepID=UPI0016510D17|nr:zinc-dependent metalloprotease family protein [Hymenobacter sp. BT188]MBC6607121.1 proprotein convertase P-domain-containing protein [Hymenobacter sp. BT188]